MEAEIAQWISWDEKHANNEGNHPAIRNTAKARIAIFKTAPRDLPRLKIEIALKTKAFNNCNAYPERDILRAELDALQSILPLLNLVKYGGPEAGFTTIEKEAEKSQALMRLRQENIDLL